MNVAEIIADAEARGVTLAPNGDKLKLRAQGPIPEDLVERLRAAKPGILAALAGSGQPAAPAAIDWRTQLDPSKPPADVPPAAWKATIRHLQSVALHPKTERACIGVEQGVVLEIGREGAFLVRGDRRVPIRPNTNIKGRERTE